MKWKKIFGKRMPLHYQSMRRQKDFLIIKRKIILTNASDEQMEPFSLVNLPYELFTLKHNPDKTDPEYFRKMLENFNLTKDDVIYFEHNPKAVASAESVGILSYHYDSEKKDLERLKNFLDNNL